MKMSKDKSTTKKESVIFYRSQVEALRHLPADDFKHVITALFDYACDDQRPNFSGNNNELAMTMVFDMIANQIDRDAEAHRRKCKKNRERVWKRWHPDDPMPENTSEYQSIPTYTKDTDTDNDNDNENDTDTDNDNDILSGTSDASVQFAEAVQEIVNYMNSICGTQYRPSTSKTKSLIRARMNEGATVDDFKTVIDKKCAEWKNDPKFSQYLRPETLFGNKFEGYLNGIVVSRPTYAPDPNDVDISMCFE